MIDEIMSVSGIHSEGRRERNEDQYWRIEMRLPGLDGAETQTHGSSKFERNWAGILCLEDAGRRRKVKVKVFYSPTSGLLTESLDKRGPTEFESSEGEAAIQTTKRTGPASIARSGSRMQGKNKIRLNQGRIVWSQRVVCPICPTVGSGVSPLPASPCVSTSERSGCVACSVDCSVLWRHWRSTNWPGSVAESGCAPRGERLWGNECNRLTSEH